MATEANHELPEIYKHATVRNVSWKPGRKYAGVGLNLASGEVIRLRLTPEAVKWIYDGIFSHPEISDGMPSPRVESPSSETP